MSKRRLVGDQFSVANEESSMTVTIPKIELEKEHMEPLE